MTVNDRKLKLAVLVSGGGTNLQALMDRAAAGCLSAEIAVVLSDRPGVHGLKRAENAGIPAHCVDYGAYLKREITKDLWDSLPVRIEDLDRNQKILRHADPGERLARLARLVLAEQEMVRILDSYKPDLVCLAGFMRLVTPYFIATLNKGAHHATRRILNIHPALLPAFPGQHGYEDTFAYGCKWGGITVHFVDEGEDTGPIVAQAVYPIWPDDDVEKVRMRGLQLEYAIYSQVVNWIAGGHIAMEQTPDGRTRVLITDPDYASVLKDLVAKAFLTR